MRQFNRIPSDHHGSFVQATFLRRLLSLAITIARSGGTCVFPSDSYEVSPEHLNVVPDVRDLSRRGYVGSLLVPLHLVPGRGELE